MSRKFSLLLILGMLLMIVAASPAFAQDDPWAEVDPTGQSVVFWHQHTGAREEALLEIVATFNETNEYGITVEAINQGGYDEIFTQMLTLLGTDELPDLTVAYTNQAVVYAQGGAIVDLTSLIDSPTWGFSEEDLADFFESFVKTDNVDGVQLGFPPNRSMEVMYYNASWLAELRAAGAISFDGPPTTPEQFQEAACAAVTNPFSAATGDTSTSVGYELSIDASRFASWTFAFGGDVFDYENYAYSYNSPEAVAAMTFIQGLFNAGCARVVSESFGDQTNFGAGVTLFTVGSSSGLPFYRTALEDQGSTFEWSVGAIPHTTEDPVQNIYGASVSITAPTAERALAAWIFVKYYTSSEVQTQWAIASNYFPARRSVAEGLESYFAENPAYEAAFNLLQYGVAEPPVPGYDFVRTEVGTAMAAISTGADIQATLDALDELANEILAEQME